MLLERFRNLHRLVGRLMSSTHCHCSCRLYNMSALQLVNVPNRMLEARFNHLLLGNVKGGSSRSCTQFFIARSYAKKMKENKKESSKRGKAETPQVTLTESELNDVIQMNKAKSQMQSTLDHLQKEYAEQLTIHMTLGLLGNLVVETKEGNLPLIQLGQVMQKNLQLMVINLATSPQHIPQTKLALIGAGLNPQQDGTMLYVPVPKVTREHRETLAKNAKVLCEKTKEKLRNIQSGYVRDLKKAKDDHSADLIFNLQQHLLSTTKEYIERAEEILMNKQKELLGQ